jgi:hypothetical protein
MRHPLVDCTAGSVVLTLPTSGTSTDEAEYRIRRIDSVGANTLTVQRVGTDLLEGATTSVTIGTGGQVDFKLPAGASNWRILARGGATPAAARASMGSGAVTDAIFRPPRHRRCAFSWPVFRAKRTTSQAPRRVSPQRCCCRPKTSTLVRASTTSRTTASSRPLRGYYQINGSAYLTGSGITTIITQIRKNGTVAAEVFHTVPGTGDHKLSVTDVIQFNGSMDYVELWASGTVTTVNFGAGSALSGSLARAT